VPGFQEWLVIALVALLVLGPNRLPEVARNAARAIARFRVEAQRNIDELKQAARREGIDEEFRELRREMRGTQSELRDGLRSAMGEEPPRRPARRTDGPPPVDLEAT
jgi:sec-independent protein translocase protein TatB